MNSSVSVALHWIMFLEKVNDKVKATAEKILLLNIYGKKY